MKAKPHLSFWQVWNMSFGFLGIQMGFALQNANVSRIFETLGANIEDIPILWIAAPVTGLIIQPIVGHMSDNTWNRLGRRRPFFLAGAILASVALLVMPNSPAIWIAAGMLWIMDASINISMEPFRAFVGDMLPNEQRTSGFAMQSFFIGTGAVVASALPYIMTNWFDVSNMAEPGQVPPSVKLAFYIGGGIFLIAVLWTVYSTKEYTPEQLNEFEKAETPLKSAKELKPKVEVNYFRQSLTWIILGVAFAYFIYAQNLAKELYILGFGIAIFGVILAITHVLKSKKASNNTLVSIIDDLFDMPKAMKQLAFVQFFSWFALFAMWIYTTSAVTNHIYHTTDTTSKIYNDGADWVGILMAVYNGFAAIIAFFLPVIAKKTSRKITHLIALMFGGAGLISFYFIKDPYMLIISEIGIGFAWASILSMPYAILTGSLPSNKMGVYMGIFNFFIVIPQILAASLLGFLLTNLFKGDTIYALVLGGVSMIIAGLLTLIVEDKDE
ncbi:Predicted maltose transporter MalT [hydrothermal vent metagenome]|uniref:Predicted maltose transporter MalT n=1 Tax=hydrothermal vent metagenome TaxID=652676 RepID=A0A3B0UFW2_9ZZZZ